MFASGSFRFPGYNFVKKETPRKMLSCEFCFFKEKKKIVFSFPNLHTGKIKAKHTIYELNTMSVFKTIPAKNQTINIH